MARWGGADHYFGTDFERAQRVFLDPASDHPGCLARWMEWRSRAASSRRRRPSRMRVAALLEEFLDSYSDEGRHQTRSYFAKHLRRFAGVFGDLFVDELDTAAVLAFRRQLLRDPAGYAPRTIAHDLGAVKTMLTYGATHHPTRVPAINLAAVRKPRLPAPDPRPLEPAGVRRFIEHCESADPRLGPWLRVNYLCLARPSEVVRMVAGAGVWEPVTDRSASPPRSHDRALFRLLESKSEHRSAQPRRVVVTDQARLWLDRCGRHWTRLDSYSKAVTRALGPPAERDPWMPDGARVLRHSAASNLHRLGVDRAACDLLLGHLPTRVSLTYNPVDWHALRASAARLTL